MRPPGFDDFDDHFNKTRERIEKTHNAMFKLAPVFIAFSIISALAVLGLIASLIYYILMSV